MLLLLLLFRSVSAQYSPNESERAKENNGIQADPSVHCGVDSISLELRTLLPFSGRVFVKGFSQEKQCQLLGNATASPFAFGIHFGQCGLRRGREIGGVSVSTTVVVSFHPIFVTKLDRAYRVNCFYAEARKTIAQQLEVGQLSTTASIRAEGKLPQCRYDILWLNAKGQAIRFAHIGDTVYHRWSCESELRDTYCMRVHSCTVSDGQGGQAVEVLDERGCGTDKLLLRDLDYAGDLSAGQSASVFKFADKPTLKFNCQIELTLREPDSGCAPNRPQCSSPAVSDGPPGIRPSYANSEAAESLVEDQSDDKSLQQTFFSAPVYGLSADKKLMPAVFRVAPERGKGGGRVPGGEELQTRVVPSRQAQERHSSRSTSTEQVLTHQQDEALLLYEDEMNEPIRSRRELSAKRVADFDLPERSLVVIDVDEQMSLVQQFLNSRNGALGPSAAQDAFPPPTFGQCPPLPSQVPPWALLLSLVLLLALLSLLLWTNWSGRRSGGAALESGDARKRRRQQMAESEEPDGTISFRF